MGALKLATALFVLHLFSSAVSSITIEKNAYKGIYISSSGGWTDQNLQKLKEVLTKSSEYLFRATRRRSYFGEFVLGDAWCHTQPSAVPRRVDVYVAPPDSSNPRLRTQHSRGCGEAGEVMYMPLGWLLQGDTADLAREFVQQWSIYRYGVFEEDPIYNGSCYRSKDSWNAVGCYDRKNVPETSPEFENGLPMCSFDLNDTSSFKNSKSSLMFTSKVSKALDFCDGSPTFPHDPAMPTLHNSLCEGKSTWSVIENSHDFKFGKNKPSLMQTPPPTAFTGFCQNNLQLTFAIQNNTSGKDLTEAVAEIGYSLYQYLLNLKDLAGSSTKAEVNVVMFSDKEDNSGPLKLDINSGNLKNEIVDYVKAFRVVSSNCVSCGFRKALDASKGGPSTIVVVAWENTIGEEDISEILRAIREGGSSGSRIHLLLVENTASDVLSAELIAALRFTGGQVFFLPKRLVAMASALHSVLTTVVKSPLKVEDDDAVVHESVFENIDGSFTDSFTTLNPENGTLEYLIHCHPLNRIVPIIQNCIHTSSNIDTYRCMEELEPDKIKLWELNHMDKGGTKPPNCSSVAILHNRESASKEKLTLKGWLSNYATEPGKDPLIVYAEIIGSSEDYHVRAEISGSDDFLVSIELRDNGNGDPDVKRGDGIFSRYFTPPALKKGSYGVKIFAESKVEATDTFYTNEPPKNGKVRRQSKSIGYFSVRNSFPEEDIFPPSRVGDLRAVSYNRDNNTVTLQWTAPGNDYDNGTATSYEIKYSTNPSSLSDPYFDSEETTEPTYKRDLAPSRSGTAEEIEIAILSGTRDLFVALRARDASDNRGNVSNIVQVRIEAASTSTQASTELDTSVHTSSVTNDDVSSELPTTEPPETSTVTGGDDEDGNFFFDKKFVVITSAAAGILLFIILINIIVCCCCCKKKKASEEKASLQPPYNVNIAYQNDSPVENDRDVSVTTMVNASIYAEPRKKQQRYTYHTTGSLSGRGKSHDQNNRDQLGFQLVETMPATRSLSRFRRRLNNDSSNSDTDSDGKPIPAPQQAHNDAHIYPLGIV